MATITICWIILHCCRLHLETPDQFSLLFCSKFNKIKNKFCCLFHTKNIKRINVWGNCYSKIISNFSGCDSAIVDKHFFHVHVFICCWSDELPGPKTSQPSWNRLYTHTLITDSSQDFEALYVILYLKYNSLNNFLNNKKLLNT